MLFNSIDFLIFFPLIVLIYYIIPYRFRYIWMLMASYYFYMQWHPAYIFLLFGTTAVTYLGGRILDKVKGTGARKCILALVIVINLTVLGYFKYSNMIMGYVDALLDFLGRPRSSWHYSVLLPVGISFFTLQALGYLIDVYRGNIEAERDFLRYALFISFFPQLVAGPIERSGNLIKQLKTPEKLSYENVRKGLLVMLYGFFLKVVIADRLAIYVDAIYDDLPGHPGFYIIVATALFAIQIYCDFYGYSTIAKGAAKVMGITLMDNFKAPFFAVKISEFWRRWHVSLSSWFTDYLYIPLGGNRKGTFRKYLNILIIFAVSGLWHGASMGYMVWGTLNGFYQLIEALFKNIWGKAASALGIGTIKDSFFKRLAGRIFTIAEFIFALVFFRSGNLATARVAFSNMVSVNNWRMLTDGSLFNDGLSMEYFLVLLVAVIIIGAVDSVKYRGEDAADTFLKKNWFLRMPLEVLLLVYIIVFGCYGNAYDVQKFIYFQF